MKHLLLIGIILQFALIIKCGPLPGGPVVYRVSNKYFNRPNGTSQNNTNSLYNLLSQIHYGGASQSIAIDTNEIQIEDISPTSSMEGIIGDAVTEGQVTTNMPEVNIYTSNHLST